MRHIVYHRPRNGGSMIFKVELGDVLMQGKQASGIADKANMMHADAQMNGRIGEIEHLLSFLLARMAMGQAVSLADEPVRRFLRVPPEAVDHPHRYLQAALSAVAPRGMLECQICQSKVKDIPGFLDEACLVCGAHVGSDG